MKAPKSSEQDALLQSISKGMERDRQRLLTKYPFISIVMMHLEFIPVLDGEIETAATDGMNVYMNCAFYMKLTLEERLFVLAHEVWHCILLHFARKQNRDAEYFNYATDLEIHFLLQEEKFKEPFVLPHDPSWKGLSAEEIYEKLSKKHKPQADPQSQSSASVTKGVSSNGKDAAQPAQTQQRGASGTLHSQETSDTLSRLEEVLSSIKKKNDGRESEHLKSQQSGLGFDQHRYDNNMDSGTRQAQTEKIRRIVIQAAQQLERRGSLPAYLQAVIKRLRTPSLDWRELLRQFVTMAFGDERHWLPPARRYLPYGLYLPRRRGCRLAGVIAIDTSGSTQDILPNFFAELKQLMTTFENYELTVIQCDTEIKGVKSFSDDTPISYQKEWEVMGLGGTDLRPPFKYVQENKLLPDIFIYLTDGFGPIPQKAPSYPVLWILPDECCDVPSWGHAAHFKTKDVDSWE